MQIPNYIVLEKQVGQTPLEALGAWRLAHPEHIDIPATYAGRLDPMASGKLLILLGDECKKKNNYTGLDKEYEIEVVLGLSTDTGDALGLASLAGPTGKIPERRIRTALQSLIGTHTVPYPAFSSKTVNGKPLFMYALEDTLSEISLPTHPETIYSIQLLDTAVLIASDLHARIQDHLTHAPRSEEPSKVLGADFRQDEVRRRWSSVLNNSADAQFALLRLRVACASGTYMRTLAERLGKELGTTGFALSIHRATIGRFIPFGPIKFWRKRY